MSSFITEPNVFSGNEFDVVKPIECSGATSLCFIVQKNGKLFFMKSLHPDLIDNAYYRTLFQKEFEFGHSITHKNIVCYEELHNSSSDCYILMENIEGETLDQFIVSRPDYFKSRANLDKFFNQLLSALKCLHQNRVVYSDMKPQNIMLTQVGNDVKLIDLGFCFNDAYSLTAGATKGYSAPEQQKDGKLNIATDIYGIGKIIEYIGQNTSGNLPNVYSKIMTQCLKKQQNDRFQDTDEITRLINKRKQTLRNILVTVAVSAVAFVAIRSITYTEIFNSWWDSFQIITPHVEFDFEHTSTLYRISSEQDLTCSVVGHKTNPNAYILPSVNIDGKTYRVTEIAKEAFFGKSYLKSVFIPEGIETIGDTSFKGCIGLATINLPNSVTHIADGAFWGCNNLHYIGLPSSVKHIGRAAFAGATIRSISIPSGVERISLDLFGNCEHLEKVTLPPTITTIDRGAFFGCKSLKQIAIPENVKNIGELVLWEAESLTDIYNYSPTPQPIPQIHHNPSQITLHVPATAVDAYKLADNWNMMNIVAIEQSN